MSAALVIQARKEARALLPWFAAVAVATLAGSIVADRVIGFPRFHFEYGMWTTMIYAVGMLSVAALSLGHELVHGTLPSLLVQPIPRLRALTIKLAVLAAILVPLGFFANWMFGYHMMPYASRPLLIWGPVVAGIGLVPVLTLLTRKPLGGVVFAVTIPGALFALGNKLHPIWAGPEAWHFAWQATAIASAVGLLALVPVFGRTQTAGEGRQQSSAAQRPAARETSTAYAGSTPRPWAWLLIKKELQLQRLTLAMSGLYVVGCAIVVMTQRLNPVYVGPTFTALSGLHLFFVSLLAGALASAEERHLGTLAAQVLLPKAARKQWALKTMVTLGLAVALTIGLPLLLMWAFHPRDAFRIEDEAVVGALLIACVGLFVSALSSNSLWALLASFPALGVALAIGAFVLDPLLQMIRRQFPFDLVNAGSVTRSQILWMRWIENNALLVLVAGLAVLTLNFAGRNHRSLDRDAGTVVRQILWLLLYSIGATLVYGVVSRIAWNLA